MTARHAAVMFYLLVVVENRVHVFDPDGVDWTVKQNPLALVTRVGRVLTERVRQDTYTQRSVSMKILLSTMKTMETIQ